MPGAAMRAAASREDDDLCRLRLDRVASEYRLALKKLRERVTAHASAGPGDRKAEAELEIAFTAVSAAREDYAVALRAFTDLIVTGKLPAAGADVLYACWP